MNIGDDSEDTCCVDRSEVISRRGSGRACGRGRGRGRGRGHGRGRGRHGKAVEDDLHAGEVTIDDSYASLDTDSAPNVEDAEYETIILVKNGNSLVEWNKMEGRILDPFLQKSYNERAEFKLHNYTEKIEREFFESVLPMDLL